jgi:AraC-like DNA-binding protein
MLFLRKNPHPDLVHLIKEFWIVENPDPTPVIQKVIPDGYCEIILHYGDPYRIKLYHTWEEQEKYLFSGQIRQFFHLENCGRSSMLGIKLMPAAAFLWFQREMSAYTDKVVPLTSMSEQLPPSQLTGGSESWDQRIHHAEHWLRQQIDIEEGLSRTEQAIQYMMDAHGMVDIETIAQSLTVTRRHLEREFKKIIGLTPKYFSRIIQFNYIFEAMQRKDNAWWMAL